MRSVPHRLILYALVVLLPVVFVGLWGWFVQIAWNGVMPKVFGLPALTWVDGVYLSVLAGLLLGTRRSTEDVAMGAARGIKR